MGILLFVLKYMFISMLLKMIKKWFSWSANVMASPFKVWLFSLQIQLNTDMNNYMPYMRYFNMSYNVIKSVYYL